RRSRGNRLGSGDTLLLDSQSAHWGSGLDPRHLRSQIGSMPAAGLTRPDLETHPPIPAETGRSRDAAAPAQQAWAIPPIADPKNRPMKVSDRRLRRGAGPRFATGNEAGKGG